MKTKGIAKLLMLYMAFCAHAAFGQNMDRPFGWACCSSETSADDYIVSGGSEKADTIVLVSNGQDMRTALSNAIKNHSVIVLDGRKGDFIVSSSVDVNELDNRTLIGINGATIRTAFTLSDDIRKALDKAKVRDASSKSGTGGMLCNGANVKEEREYLTRKTIIELTGDTLEAYRKSGVINIKRANNWIVRGLRLYGPGSCDVGGTDVMSLYSATHVWIDHCEFMNGMDGNLDITNESDFVTVSFCKFSYDSLSYDHMNSNLVGGSDKNIKDMGKLHVTYAYNIWGKGCMQRMPMVRYGFVHVLNNYYDCPGNIGGINPRIGSYVLAEGNYFGKGVKKIFRDNNSVAYTICDNYYSEKFVQPEDKGSVAVPYKYGFIEPSDLAKMLKVED